MRSLKSRLSQALSQKLIEPLRNPALEKKSVHEEALRDYFEALNVPKSTVPLERPVCIMLFTNRSGSNAIGEHLRATGRFSGFREALNQKRILKLAEKNQLTDFGGYLEWLMSRKNTADTLFGMKASADQAMMLYRSGAIPHYFNKIHWVLVQRHDILGQAISFSIAAQTRQWSTGEEAGQVEPNYNFNDIKHRVSTITASYAEMNAFCALFGIEPHRVIYEDFLADPGACTSALAAAMDVPGVRVDDTQLTMRIQRDERNQVFRERFIADYAKEQAAYYSAPAK